MHKSTTDSVGTEKRLISKLDVGNRVVVNGHFGGRLKYVGKILDKEGMFCGVELDEPIGKNNGSYKGVVYFDSRPKHGIFAPIHKVLLEPENASRLARPSVKSPLTKSTISTDSCKSSSTGSQVGPTPNRHSTMEWSLMSTTSSCLDTSLISSNQSTPRKYANIDDLMMNSNTTYTVVADSDCLMLCDIEIPDSDPLSLEEDEENTNANRNARSLLETSQAGSVVLGECSLDPSMLPVVCDSSDDEELPTPMTAVAAAILQNESSVPNANPQAAEVPTKRAEKRSATDLNSKTLIREAEINAECNPVDNPRSTELQGVKSTKQSIPIKPPAVAKPRDAEQRQRPAQQRQMANIRSEMTDRPAKKPTKSQQVMEMIAASIAAERQKAKVETKAKVATTTTTATSTTPLVSLPNGTTLPQERKTEYKKPIRPSPTLRNPSRSSSRENTARTKSKVNTPALTKNRSRNTSRSTIDYVPSVKLPPKGAVTRLNGTVAALKPKISVVQPRKSQLSQLEEKHNIELEELKSKFSAELKDAEEKLLSLKEEKTKELDALRQSHSQELNTLLCEHKSSLEQLSREINSSKAEHANQLIGELAKLRSELTVCHQKEVSELAERSVLECNRLDSALQENRRLVESLEKEKRELEDIFKQDESEKIKKLAADVDSVKYELECKMGELKRLRAENANLQFASDSVHAKDLEIQKLSHRLKDLGAELLHKIEIEKAELIKALNQQLEESRKEIKTRLAQVEEARKANDTLLYRLSELDGSLNGREENGISIRTNGIKTANGRPSSSQFPSHSSPYPLRDAYQGRLDENAMAKSLDSTNLSLYQSQGRHRTLNTPTKIYAPDGTYEVHDDVACVKLLAEELS